MDCASCYSHKCFFLNKFSWVNAHSWVLFVKEFYLFLGYFKLAPGTVVRSLALRNSLFNRREHLRWNIHKSSARLLLLPPGPHPFKPPIFQTFSYFQIYTGPTKLPFMTRLHLFLQAKSRVRAPLAGGKGRPGGFICSWSLAHSSTAGSFGELFVKHLSGVFLFHLSAASWFEVTVVCVICFSNEVSIAKRTAI